MIKPVGGRGKKAPYQTENIRVPVPMKSLIVDMIAEYRTFVMQGSNPDDLSCIKDRNVGFDEAKKIASKILKQKQSARKSLTKLLASLYDIDCKPEDL